MGGADDLSAEPAPLRVLVLSPFAPRLDAAHGGSRAIAELVAGLAERHRVALLCLRPAGDPPTDDLLRQRCELVEEFELPGHGSPLLERWRRHGRLLAGLARGRPMWAVDTFVPRLADRVREVGQSWRPNVAQAEYHVMAQYLGTELGPEVARVLTEEEPGTTMAEAVRRDSHGLARPLLRADAAAWRRFESAILREVDAVVAYTESDRRALQSLAPEVRVVRIPLGVRVPPEPLSAAGTEPESLVFVGNFMHPPNVDAAKRLLDGILPLVLAHRPEARIYLVGDRVPDFLRRAKAPNAIVTGFVDDVTPYLHRAAVVVAPLRRGGGQRVKVMEALAAGKAVVASRLAVDGLDVADEEHVVLAETDDEFANAVLRLLDDEERRSALGSRARMWAQAHLGVHHTVEGYEQLYAELLRERKRRSCR